MKKHLPLIITATLTIAVLSGCTTLTRFGITEDTVVAGVQLALAKHDLTGAVSAAQLTEIITIVKAEQRLQEIGEEVAQDQRIQNLIEEIVGRYVIDGKVVVPANKEEVEAPPGVPDEAVYADFIWKYGGEKMPNARNDGSVVIALKKLSANAIDFSWEKDLSAWGIARDHADALVCAFVQDGSGQWIGGKFDWISSSRTNRDFGHLGTATTEGYKGWNLEGIPNPTRLAFVVVERNGRRRSNVVAADWRR